MIKGITKRIFAGVVILAIGVAPVSASSADGSTIKLIRTAMQTTVMVQRIAKAYLYKGNGVAVNKASRELEQSLKAFNTKNKFLEDSINDAKVKNLLSFVDSSMEDVNEILKQPYSLDNAQELIDAAETISEGERSIANKLKKKLSSKPPVFRGQRYYVTQVAKYYMAYGAGIKDDITIRNMNNTVKKLQKLISDMKAYPNNTPEMNRIIHKIDKEWKIVHQFYLDIKDGDLPLIVYNTTNKLDKLFFDYTQAFLKLKSSAK